MNKPMRNVMLLCSLSLVSSVAMAKDEYFTFINKSNETANLYHDEHMCIHHPSRFNTTIAPGEKKVIGADWSSGVGCGMSDASHINVCVQKSCVEAKRNGSQVIYTITEKDGIFSMQ